MYHRLATRTVPWGREGSGHFFCPKHRSSGSSFSVQTSSFKSPNRERMGNGTLKPTTGPWFVIAIWQTKKKKKKHKRKLMSNTLSSSPLLCCMLHCHLPQSVLYSNQRIFWASQNAISPHWEWNRAHLHWSLYSSNHYSMLAWTGSSYRQRWVLKIK